MKLRRLGSNIESSPHDNRAGQAVKDLQRTYQGIIERHGDGVLDLLGCGGSCVKRLLWNQSDQKALCPAVSLQGSRCLLDNARSEWREEFMANANASVVKCRSCRVAAWQTGFPRSHLLVDEGAYVIPLLGQLARPIRPELCP